MLNGKKIIFIGDSFVFYGKAVLNKVGSRYDDRGYFYQICKNNGADVTVTNWTYGGAGTRWIYDNTMNELKDFYYDYVIISLGRKSSHTGEAYIETITKIMSVFKEQNPNVKLFILVTSGCHNISVKESFPIDLLNNLDTIEETFNATIVDWGKLVADIIRGEVQVPGAKNVFNKNSFVVHKSDIDGFHPNMLAGYITALMTYCAITGESAVGQKYDFCANIAVNEAYNSETYINTYYTCGATNFTEILNSEDDMRGLQTLIDKYLKDKSYKDYNFMVSNS